MLQYSSQRKEKQCTDCTSCLDCSASKLIHSLLRLEKITPTESVDVDQAYLHQLKNKIENDGIWTHPIIVEKSTLFLLDGNYRYHAAQLLGLEYVPCLIIGYDSIHFDVYCSKTNKLLDKEWLLKQYQKGTLLPYKSTKHVFHSEITQTAIDINLLLSGPSSAKVIKFPYEINYPNVYTEIEFLTPAKILLKNEGLNISGSIKHKPALKMVCGLEKKYGDKLNLVESSSGSLGVALSIICASRGHDFTCVVDPNISPFKKNLMEAYNTKLVCVDTPDDNGGYLGTRIDTIKNMLKEDHSLIWVNQYENENNPLSHYETTAKEIFNFIQDIDYLFVGAGTTGTLMGCASFFKKHSPQTKVIAVDVEGSVTFGGKPHKRYIPGLGTSKAPAICDRCKLDDVIYVSELETVKMCNDLRNKGFLYGGSTGTVLAGISKYNQTIHELGQSLTIVTLSPDFGEHYLSTVYSREWVSTHLS